MKMAQSEPNRRFGEFRKLLSAIMLSHLIDFRVTPNAPPRGLLAVLSRALGDVRAAKNAMRAACGRHGIDGPSPVGLDPRAEATRCTFGGTGAQR